MFLLNYGNKIGKQWNAMEWNGTAPKPNWACFACYLKTTKHFLEKITRIQKANCLKTNIKISVRHTVLELLIKLTVHNIILVNNFRTVHPIKFPLPFWSFSDNML